MGQFSKKWEDLNFSDNFIFCKVLKDKKICSQLLEILLGIKVSRIDFAESEHQLENYYDSRGIRMDVYVKDPERIFDIEIQTGNYDDLLMRSRYYLAASDISSTPRRTKFRDLKETYVIFICRDDPFGAGLPCYTEEKTFKETNQVVFDDKSHKVFYNSSAFAKADNSEVRAVLEFIYNFNSSTPFTQELELKSRDAKAKSTFKDEYMYFADILEDEKEEARATGLAEGRATGLEEGRATGLEEGRAEGRCEGEKSATLKNAVISVREFNLSPEIVAEKFGISLQLLQAELCK